MKSTLFILLIASALFCSAQQPTTDPAMIKFFGGNWSCAGEFASGKKVEADVSFAPELDGKWLLYRHADRPPGQFKALASVGRGSAQRKPGLRDGRQFRQCKVIHQRWLEGWIGNLQPRWNA